MTDAEAKKVLQRMRGRYEPEFDSHLALDHALQAIADRAALAADFDSEIGVKVSTMDAARRHMRGEP